MKSKLMLAAALAAVLGVGAVTAAAAAGPGYIAAAVADKGRPAADLKRDAERKPAEVLAFAGVKPGMTVVELIPGGGYFTRILSKAVGPKGVVYALYPPPRASTDPAKPTPTPAAEAIAADAAYGNVKPVKIAPGKLDVPTKADVVWTSQNYHDLHNVPNLDMAVFNKAVFDALKPGGVYVIEDHVASPGDPAVTHTLHRIDPAVVKQEVTAAGFKFDGESNILHNPADDHTKAVFDPSLRGHTDQFIYKFRKPR
ncbi:MAG TPA: methyltransferase [Phenylobacterium sp.]|nr:methyltransferase [Phenylobacterium sp.]